MGGRIAVVMLLATLALPGAEKKTPSARNQNDDVQISATLYADKDSVRGVLGSDLNGHYVVLNVTVTPRWERELDLRRDDFLLRTDKDGERTTPFAPSQIAGKGVLVISQTAGGGGAVMGEDRGPVFGGGYPGSIGGRGRLGGDGGGIGNAGTVVENQATVRDTDKDSDNPLLATLKEKILAEKKTDQPVSGLLYFPLGKQKVKDLELIYASSGGKLSLRFR
jgi:hypothetical protein